MKKRDERVEDEKTQNFVSFQWIESASIYYNLFLLFYIILSIISYYYSYLFLIFVQFLYWLSDKTNSYIILMKLNQFGTMGASSKDA